MPKTIAEELAEFSHGLSFDKIPSDVVEKIKQLILDTVGISISSTKMPFGTATTGLVSGWGGAQESTIIGQRQKVPAQNAAFCNGVLAHGQDYDDTHTESVVHPSAALFPVAIAVAEQTKASGQAMLAALVAGTEAAICLAMPVPNKFHQRGFHTTSVATTFGAALIAAKLRGLSVQQTTHGLGVCGTFVSGLAECVPAGADSKRLHAGWGGMSGTIAAQLAEVGFSGPATVFEGKLGLYNSLLRGETPDLGNICAPLGHEWEVLNIRPKLYPCCHYLQAYLDCAVAIRHAHGVLPAQIKKITCRTAAGAVNIVCEPWDKKLNPTTGYGARFSLPFAVSLMFAKGKAGTAEFSEELLTDPEIRQLMAKVSYEVDPQYEVKNMPGWVEVVLKNGETLHYEVAVVRGDKANPIKLRELQDKFNANTRFLPQSMRSKLAADILRLEQLQDVRELTAQFSAPELSTRVA